MITINNEWKDILADEYAKDYYKDLISFLHEEYKTKTIYPEWDDIFNAFNYTSYHKVKVVIIGQDPYHGKGQAHGLSFSVKPNTKLPPSLKNIFKELKNDIGCKTENNGGLIKWANQGVLLLNTVLTVREGQPNSHKGRGWEKFTNHVITTLNARKKPVIFILWGKHAQEKISLINITHHYIITSAHPSPLAAHKGFFGSKPFSNANNFLKEMGETEINWCI